MLPEDWKREIEETINKAGDRAAEYEKRQIESNNAIAAPLDRLANEFVRYENETNEREQGKRRREIATIWGLFINAGLVLMTAAIFYCQLRVFQQTDNTLNKTMIAADRARIVPHLLKLIAPLQAGQEASGVLFYGNSGREAARMVGRFDEAVSVVIPTNTSQLNVTKTLRDQINNFPFKDSCAIAKTNRFSGVIYPGGLDGNTSGIYVEPKWIVQSTIDGLGFVIVKGCFVYETFNELHRSEYCFTYNQRIDGLKLPEHRMFFSNCPTGNDAD